MKFVANLDLNKNQLLNARLQNLATTPAGMLEGQLYFDTTDDAAYIKSSKGLEKISGLTASEITDMINASGETVSNSNLSTEVNDAINKRHTQNTDIGTTSSTFYLGGTGGVKLKNSSGTVQVRNSTDNAFVNLQAKDITSEGVLAVKGVTYLGDNATTDSTTIKGLAKVISKTTKASGSNSIDTFRVEDSVGGELFSVKENGDTIIGGVLTVNGTGETTFAGNVSIGGALNVADGTTATADMSGDNLTLTGDLNVNGNTVLGDNASQDTTLIKGFTSIESKTTKELGSESANAFQVMDSSGTGLLEVRENGNTIIGGVLTVTGTGESNFAGDVNIGGALTVDKNATVNADFTGADLTLTGNLVVQGNTEIGDNASVDITTIKGATTIYSKTTKVLGSTTANAFQVLDSTGDGLFEVKENGDTVIGGVLTVSGTGESTFTGDVSIGGALTVDKNTTATADMSGESLTLTGDLNVHGDTVLGDNAAVDKTTIKGLTRVVSKTTKVLGDAGVDAFRVEDSTGGELFSVRENGNTVIGGVLTVNGEGQSNFTGDVSIGGALTVDKNATVNADFTGTDLTLTGNLVVQGNTEIGDNAAVDITTIKGATTIYSKTTKELGSTTANAFQVLDSAGDGLFEVKENGDTVIGGVLTVSGTGESTFTGDVSIGGALTVDKNTTATADMSGESLTLTGDLNVHGDTVLGDNAAVDKTTIKGLTRVISKTTKATGSSSVDSFRVEDSVGASLFAVKENGDTVIGGVLTVNGTGESTFSGDVNIAGSINVAENATVNADFTGDSLELTGNLTVNGDTTLGNDVGDTTTVIGNVVLPSSTIIGGVTQASISDAVNKKHGQNSDVGTSSQTFYIGGAGGAKIKHSDGEIQVRNSADNSFADIRVRNLYTEGPMTSIISNEVKIGDSDILLNSDITTSIQNSDGGITVKRLKSDNITRADAKMTFNDSTGRWESSFGSVDSLKTKTVAQKHTEVIGDGTATSFTVTHGLGTRAVTVTVAESSSPFGMVMPDIEMTTLDTITVMFGSAPTAGEYTVTITG